MIFAGREPDQAGNRIGRENVTEKRSWNRERPPRGTPAQGYWRRGRARRESENGLPEPAQDFADAGGDADRDLVVAACLPCQSSRQDNQPSRLMPLVAATRRRPVAAIRSIDHVWRKAL